MNRIDIQKQSTFFIFLAILLLFIPFGKSNIFPIAPINLVYLAIGFLFFFQTIYSKRNVDYYVFMIIMTIIIYQVLVYYLDLIKYGSAENFYFIYKTIILLLGFSILKLEKNLFRLFKLFTLIIFFAAFFGLLIYFIGEPFSSIRMAILGSENPYAIYVGKGDRISGFDSKIFTFAYPLAALPILLLTLYKMENSRPLYLILLFITSIAIILNGERATAFFSILGLIYLSYQWFKMKRIFFTIIGLLLCFGLIQITNLSIDQNNLTRLVTQKEEGEIATRLFRQFIGLKSIYDSPFLGSHRETYENLFYNEMNEKPASTHNAIINVGVRAGVIGWLMFGIFIYYIFQLTKIMKSKMSYFSYQITLFHGIAVSLIVTQLVGLVHNAGIFYSYEKTSIILLGFIIALSNMTDRYSDMNIAQKNF